MGKHIYFKIVFILYIIFLTGCEKEEEINDPELPDLDTNIDLSLGGAQCAYDTSSNIFYYPVSSDTIQEYTTLVNHSYAVKVIYLNGKKLVNNSYNNLGAIYVNKPYKLQVGYDEEVYKEYELVFTTLPIIQIFTSLEIVDEPKNLAKALINNPYYQIDNELYRELGSFIGIEIRGGVAKSYPKLSYAFELWQNTHGDKEKDFSLLGMRQDDDWILDGMYNDKMRMRNRISFDIWNSISCLHYSDEEPKAICGINGKFVEVFINNSYQGLYCLNEKMDRKQLKLKRFNKNIRGLLYKAKEWGEGSTTFYSYRDTTSDIMWDGWEQEYPEPEDKIIWTPLYNLVKFIVDSDDNEFKDNISQYFDMNNAIDYYIFLNLIKGHDNTGKNTFIARYDTNSVFFYVPWDMDGTWGRHWDSSIAKYTGVLTNNLYTRLLNTNPDNFKSKVNERWKSLREDELTIESLISQIEVYKNKFVQCGVIERENKKWENTDLNLEEEFNLVKEWINNRIFYLDNFFNNLE